MYLNDLMDHVLYQIFKIILSIPSKYNKLADNLPRKTYVIKVENELQLKLSQSIVSNL